MENSAEKFDNEYREYSENIKQYMAEREARRKKIQAAISAARNQISHRTENKVNTGSKTIEDKIVDKEEVRKKTLDNDEKEQDIKLKKETLDKLFKFLTWESIVVFILVFIQGFSFFDFKLEPWSFRLLLAATITQITIMLQIAVKHIFPKK